MPFWIRSDFFLPWNTKETALFHTVTVNLDAIKVKKSARERLKRWAYFLFRVTQKKMFWRLFKLLFPYGDNETECHRDSKNDKKSKLKYFFLCKGKGRKVVICWISHLYFSYLNLQVRQTWRSKFWSTKFQYRVNKWWQNCNYSFKE